MQDFPALTLVRLLRTLTGRSLSDCQATLNDWFPPTGEGCRDVAPARLRDCFEFCGTHAKALREAEGEEEREVLEARLERSQREQERLRAVLGCIEKLAGDL